MATYPVTGLDIDLSPLEDRIQALEEAPAAVDDDTALEQQIASLQALVDANATKASGDVKALSDQVASLEAADKVEDDSQNAQLVDLANRIGANSGGSAPDPENAILLDAMPGSNDDAKLDAAWTIAQASNPRRPIRLSARNHSFTKTRTTFSGLRILGPNTGWQNPEIGGTSGALSQCNVSLNITNSGFWLTGTATTYDVEIAGICFKSGNASSFYHHPYSAGTCYAGHFADLTFYGFKYVMGKPGDAFAMTLCTFAGIWTLVAVQGEQFSLRGSDNWLVPDAMNYGWVGNNGGRYLVRFENLMKTTVANWYLTARGGSRAVLVDGTSGSQGGLTVNNCVIEGQNLNDPAMGALIVVKGGGVSFRDTCLNFGMARPSDFTDQTDTALVMVKGGVCTLDTVWTGKANTPGTSTPVTAPVLEVSGGVGSIRNVFGVQPIGSTSTVRKVGGTLVKDDTVQLL